MLGYMKTTFGHWTEFDAAIHNRKVSKAVVEIAAGPVDAVENEGDLHDEIMDELRSLGWAYAHNRMDKKSTAGNGVTDFIIAASRGRTFWIECKSRTGKRTTAQLGFAAQLERFGHVAYLCKSIAEFREIIK